ncbi:MAG: sensor histidine kinase [Mangrovibacterium sp.]
MKESNYSNPEKLVKTREDELSLQNSQFVKGLLSVTSSVVCVLNDQREVIFANEILINKYGLDLERDILGLPFGEVMNCVSLKSPGSVCGLTDKCKYCGANSSFNDFLNRHEPVVNEYRLVREVDGIVQQVDLEITVQPFRMDSNYMIVSMVDITDLRRREILERIFFHDIINMAGSLSGVLELLKEPECRNDESFFEVAASLSMQIVEEIKGQQHVLKAEKGELEVNVRQLKMDKFLEELCNKVKYSKEAFERHIDVFDFSGNASFVSDPVLLNRVVFNMAKNALEAIPRGDRIRIEAYKQSGTIRIEVHNNTVMDENVRNQLFQRSYSTKGKNRGIGTYSMKLLGERYLKGQVNFSSSETSGTIFFIQIPVSF